MTTIVKAKNKINKRFGEDLWGRGKVFKAQKSFGNYPMSRRRGSDYSVQMSAKQKLKHHYANIRERKFKAYYIMACRMKGNTEENMIGLLERRLDTALFRTGLVRTMHSARQIISHKHVLVNDKVVNVSSFLLSPGDVVSIKEIMHQTSRASLETEKREVPLYLALDTEVLKFSYVKVPSISEVPYPVIMSPRLIVEYYSKNG